MYHKICENCGSDHRNLRILPLCNNSVTLITDASSSLGHGAPLSLKVRGGEGLMNKRVSDIRPPAGPYDDICYLFERMANLLGTREGSVKPKRAAHEAKEAAAAKDGPAVLRPRLAQDK